MVRKWICFCCLIFLTGCTVRESSTVNTAQSMTDEEQYETFEASLKEMFAYQENGHGANSSYLNSQKPITYWQTGLETIFSEHGYGFPTPFFAACEADFEQGLAQFHADADNTFSRNYAEVQAPFVFEYNLWAADKDRNYSLTVSNRNIQSIMVPEAYLDFIVSEEFTLVNYAATVDGFMITYRNDVRRAYLSDNYTIATFFIKDGSVQKLSIQTLQNISTLPNKSTDAPQWTVLLDKMGMDDQEQSQLLDLYQHLSLGITRDTTKTSMIGEYEVRSVVLNPHDVIAKGIQITKRK